MGIFPEGYVTALAGKNYICQCLKDTVSPITEIRLGFPKRLIKIKGKVSGIMKEWSKIISDHPFVKADISQQIALSQELEKETDEKNLIYTFATVPFNPENDTLRRLWEELFATVLDGENIRFSDYDFGGGKKMQYFRGNDEELQSLETTYQQYDMLHYLIDRYGDPDCVQSDKEQIAERKKSIAGRIAEILSTKKFSRKRCRDCGRALPWNYRFGICQECYEERRQARRYYRYDDDWDDEDDWDEDFDY